MSRTVFEKLATMQMLDVSVATTDGRELLLVGRTEPGSVRQGSCCRNGRVSDTVMPPVFSASGNRPGR